MAMRHAPIRPRRNAAAPLQGDGVGCHAGARTQMREAAAAAGKSEMLDALRRATTRKGPHDQPQSMCPAFGSLRVGLRMRRTHDHPVGLAPAACTA
jgi:chlorophyllide a reductase subunit Y